VLDDCLVLMFKLYEDEANRRMRTLNEILEKTARSGPLHLSGLQSRSALRDFSR
jgi:hypothetical protein